MTDGWVLVPREPTGAMVEAGGQVLDGSTLDLPDFHIVAKVYAAALAAAPPVDGWQPMETAPRDGGDILLTYGGDDCTVARPNGDGSFDDGDFRDHMSGFTHWMPLPQPPNNERTPA